MNRSEKRSKQESAEQPDSELERALTEKMGEDARQEKPEMSFGDRFAADANEYMVQWQRLMDKQSEMDELNEIPIDASKELARANLQLEMDAINVSINNVTDKYGSTMDKFVEDAEALDRIKRQLAAEKSGLKGKKQKEIPAATKERIADLQAEEAVLLGSYDQAENQAKAEVAGAGGGIETALRPLKEAQLAAELDTMAAGMPEGAPPTIPEKKEAGLTEAEIINEANSFEKLKTVVTALGEIEGSDGTVYSSKEINDTIDFVRKNPKAVNLVTRTFGLREKIAELLELNAMADEVGKIAEEYGDEEAAPDTERIPDTQRMSEEAAPDTVREKPEIIREKEKALGKAIKEATDLKTLAAALREAGTVTNREGREYDAAQIAALIDAFAESGADPESFAVNAITNGGELGIRDKVKALLKEAAEAPLEEAVAYRADNVSEAHKQGQELEPIETELRGLRSEALQKMTAEQERESLELLPGIGALRDQLDKEERTLESLGLNGTDADGVRKIDRFMTKRAIGGGIGKAGDLLGGLFNRKKREMNRAADAYQDTLNKYADALREFEKKQKLTPEQQAVLNRLNQNRR